jgi:signal transduction histidine kinase
MRRAVEALDFATSVESDFKGGTIVVKVSDIAEFLSRLQRNLSSQGTQVRYIGPGAGVIAIFDSITLDQVLSNLLNNAVRHQISGTEIEISLRLTDAGATIEIYNQGPNIPAEELDSIFNYGFSSHISPENRGIGLFTARVYMLGMNGSLYAENRPNGVALVIILPTP